MPRSKHHRSGKALCSLEAITRYEWVRNDMLKYHSLIMSPESIGILWCQLEMTKLRDSSKVALVACRENGYPFMRPLLNEHLFFFVYRCMFKVLHLTLPFSTFQCALLKSFNVAPS